MWYLISVRNKIGKIATVIGFFIQFILISSCAHDTGSIAQETPYYREQGLFRHAGRLLEQGDFIQARNLYEQFLAKFPKHPYTDDAAYRLAYMHVMAEDNNPYFDYAKARAVFQNFIETYQNSHYISACKNWIYVLDFNSRQIDTGEGTAGTGNRINNASILQENQRLRQENASLKENLEQLQQAIER